MGMSSDNLTESADSRTTGLRVGPKDWDFIEALAEASSESAFGAGIKTEALFVKPRTRLPQLGLHYQAHLYALVRIAKPHIVVETGVRSGVSTKFILSALDTNRRGCLYSCDPSYQSQEAAFLKLRRTVQIDETRAPWTFYPGLSKDVLPELALLKPEWDMFVHDSDHEYQNMYFELSFAWQRLRVGGWIVCDDWGGTQNSAGLIEHPHHAFEDFVSERGLSWTTIGHAAIVQKPATCESQEES